MVFHLKVINVANVTQPKIVHKYINGQRPGIEEKNVAVCRGPSQISAVESWVGH